MLTPEQLVSACLANGEQALWAEFVGRFRPLISTVVLRTARQWGEPIPGLVDDLIQETFLKLCANDCRLLRNFRAQHPSAFFGFLKVITANVVHDHCKASHAVKRRTTHAVASLEGRGSKGEFALPEQPFSNCSALEQSVLFDQVDRCIANGVSPDEVARSRKIFWLYYRSGLSARAIAALPQINLTTKGVESTILRLNRLVREALAGPRQKTAWNDEKSGLEKKGLHRAGSL